MKCCDITAGMLRNLVSLQSQQTVADGLGGGALNWIPYAVDVPSALQPKAARENVFAKRLETNVTHTLIMRYRTDINTAHRVVYNSRQFQIRGILNLEERSVWLQLALEEGPIT